MPGLDGIEYHTLYADKPIILKDSSSNKSQIQFYNEDKEWEVVSINDKTKLKLVSQLTIIDICEGKYPFPDVIQVVYEGTTFTFTPIPVYE